MLLGRSLTLGLLCFRQERHDAKASPFWLGGFGNLTRPIRFHPVNGYD